MSWQLLLLANAWLPTCFLPPRPCECTATTSLPNFLYPPPESSELSHLTPHPLLAPNPLRPLIPLRVKQLTRSVSRPPVLRSCCFFVFVWAFHLQHSKPWICLVLSACPLWCPAFSLSHSQRRLACFFSSRSRRESTTNCHHPGCTCICFTMKVLTWCCSSPQTHDFMTSHGSLAIPITRDLR